MYFKIIYQEELVIDSQISPRHSKTPIYWSKVCATTNGHNFLCRLDNIWPVHRTTDPSKVWALVPQKSKVYWSQQRLWPLRCPQRNLQFLLLRSPCRVSEPYDKPLYGLSNMGEKKKKKNSKNSGHLRLCQQPRAVHALRSDQKLRQRGIFQKVVLRFQM